MSFVGVFRKLVNLPSKPGMVQVHVTRQPKSRDFLCGILIKQEIPYEVVQMFQRRGLSMSYAIFVPKGKAIEAKKIVSEHLIEMVNVGESETKFQWAYVLALLVFAGVLFYFTEIKH